MKCKIVHYNLKLIKDEKQTGIWIDSTKAIIVSLEDGKEAVTEIQSELENRVYHAKKEIKEVSLLDSILTLKII
jgi:hypothetical protein